MKQQHHIFLPMEPDEKALSTISIVALWPSRERAEDAEPIDINAMIPIPFCSCAFIDCNAPRHKYSPETNWGY
jgi:hypothetical protein